MELVAYVFYLLASHSFVVLFASIILAIGVFSAVSARLKGSYDSRSLLGDEEEAHQGFFQGKIVTGLFVAGFFIAVCLILISFVNLIRPHILDGALIMRYGEIADATVLTVEDTGNLHNKQRVMRHRIIFKMANGEDMETSFDTWDFNVYPSANSVRYPGRGESFRIVYLPSFPEAFLILTEDASQYSKTERCKPILAEVEAMRLRTEFDPENTVYKREYEQATAKAAKDGCTKNLPDDMPVPDSNISPR